MSALPLEYFFKVSYWKDENSNDSTELTDEDQEFEQTLEELTATHYERTLELNARKREERSVHKNYTLNQTRNTKDIKKQKRKEKASRIGQKIGDRCIRYERKTIEEQRVAELLLLESPLEPSITTSRTFCRRVSTHFPSRLPPSIGVSSWSRVSSRRGITRVSKTDLHQVSQETGLTVQSLVDLQNRDLTPEDYELLLQLDKAVKPKTLTLDQLDSFPTSVLQTQDLHEGDRCSVCMTEYECGESSKTLPCGHRFHAACIVKWLTTSSINCPLDGLPTLK
jgi:hypothetical protein